MVLPAEDVPNPDRYEVEAGEIYFVSEGERTLIYEAVGVIVDVATQASERTPSNLVYEVVENGCDHSVHSVSPITADTVLEPAASLPALDRSGTFLAFVRVVDCERTGEVFVRDLVSGELTLVGDFDGGHDGPAVEVRDLAIAGTTLAVLTTAIDGVPIYEDAGLFSVSVGTGQPVVDPIGALDFPPGSLTEWHSLVALEDFLFIEASERRVTDGPVVVQRYVLSDRSLDAEFPVPGRLAGMAQDPDGLFIFYIVAGNDGERVLNIVDNDGKLVSTTPTALDYLAIP